jgi:hypothetical protein
VASSPWRTIGGLPQRHGVRARPAPSPSPSGRAACARGRGRVSRPGRRPAAGPSHRGGWRGDHLQAGHVGEPGLDVLGVEGTRPRAAADGEAHHHGHARPPAVVRLRQVVTIWLKPQVTKSPNCISTMGRSRPGRGRARRPRRPDSMIGVLRTRAFRTPPPGPWVALKHAAVLGDVLPQEHRPRGSWRRRLGEAVADGVDVAELGRLSRRCACSCTWLGALDVRQLRLRSGVRDRRRQRLVRRGRRRAP